MFCDRMKYVTMPKIQCIEYRYHMYVDFLLKTYLNIRFHKKILRLIWDMTWKKLKDLGFKEKWDWRFEILLSDLNTFLERFKI